MCGTTTIRRNKRFLNDAKFQKEFWPTVAAAATTPTRTLTRGYFSIDLRLCVCVCVRLCFVCSHKEVNTFLF